MILRSINVSPSDGSLFATLFFTYIHDSEVIVATKCELAEDFVWRRYGECKSERADLHGSRKVRIPSADWSELWMIGMFNRQPVDVAFVHQFSFLSHIL